MQTALWPLMVISLSYAIGSFFVQCLIEFQLVASRCCIGIYFFIAPPAECSIFIFTSFVFITLEEFAVGDGKKCCMSSLTKPLPPCNSAAYQLNIASTVSCTYKTYVKPVNTKMNNLTIKMKQLKQEDSACELRFLLHSRYKNCCTQYQRILYILRCFPASWVNYGRRSPE